MRLRSRADITPARPPLAAGFVLTCPYATGRGTFSLVEWHFPTIEAARDFCTLCDLAWSLTVEPRGGGGHMKAEAT